MIVMQRPCALKIPRPLFAGKPVLHRVENHAIVIAPRNAGAPPPDGVDLVVKVQWLQDLQNQGQVMAHFQLEQHLSPAQVLRAASSRMLPNGTLIHFDLKLAGVPGGSTYDYMLLRNLHGTALFFGPTGHLDWKWAALQASPPVRRAAEHT